MKMILEYVAGIFISLGAIIGAGAVMVIATLAATWPFWVALACIVYIFF